MGPVCELHGEMRDRVDERVDEIKAALKEHHDGAEKRWEAIRKLDSSKLSWGTFTWIIGLLMVVWLGVNTFILSKVERVESNILTEIKEDKKKDHEQRTETWRRIGELKDSMQALSWKVDNLSSHDASSKKKGNKE